jgi:hypothetical protein
MTSLCRQDMSREIGVPRATGPRTRTYPTRSRPHFVHRPRLLERAQATLYLGTASTPSTNPTPRSRRAPNNLIDLADAPLRGAVTDALVVSRDALLRPWTARLSHIRHARIPLPTAIRHADGIGWGWGTRDHGSRLRSRQTGCGILDHGSPYLERARSTGRRLQISMDRVAWRPRETHRRVTAQCLGTQDVSLPGIDLARALDPNISQFTALRPRGL